MTTEEDLRRLEDSARACDRAAKAADAVPVTGPGWAMTLRIAASWFRGAKWLMERERG